MRSSSTPGSPCSVWACAAPSRPTPSRPIFIIPPATSLVADASVRIYDCRHTGVKLAAAPISWGVCEVPGWGHQLAADRVLADAARLGFREIELGPPGFLPDEPVAARELIARHGLRIVAAFVTAVLHEAQTVEAELRAVERQAKHLASLGGSVLVLGAALRSHGYEAAAVLSNEQWRTLLANLARISAIAQRQGLVAALHPHVGTA